MIVFRFEKLEEHCYHWFERTLLHMLHQQIKGSSFPLFPNLTLPSSKEVPMALSITTEGIIVFGTICSTSRSSRERILLSTMVLRRLCKSAYRMRICNGSPKIRLWSSTPRCLMLIQINPNRRLRIWRIKWRIFWISCPRYKLLQRRKRRSKARRKSKRSGRRSLEE